MKKVLPILLVLALIGGAVYYYFTREPAEIIITGIVTTDDIIVSSQVQGRLQSLKVREGDTVEKGDLLATIQPEQWAADMSYYESTEKQAATQVSQAEAELRFEETQTSSEIAQAKANLAAADAQVKQANADLENARLTFVHEEDAWKRGAEGQQAYDTARTGYEAQKARIEAVKKQRDAAAAAVEVAQSNLEQVAMKRAALEVNRHQLAAATAQKDKAKVQLGYTEIVAPLDGIVDVRASYQGEVVNPGQAIVTLINPDDLWVRADVEETYIDRIHIGDRMQVRLPSGRQLAGTVFFRGVDAGFATQRDVSRTKRDIKTFEVRLRCDNTDRSLAVGMTTYVILPLGATGGSAAPPGPAATAPATRPADLQARGK